MTFPGAGGQVPPRPDQQQPPQQPPVPVSPGGSVIVAQRVIIVGANGELLVYNPTRATGNLIASIAGQAGTDGLGDTVEEGITAYVVIGGHTIAVQLGQGSFFGTPAAGFFSTDLTTPPAVAPFLGSLGNGIVVISTGQSTGLATAAGIECEDSVVSGLANGNINLVAGSLSGAINIPQTPTQTLQGAAPAAYSQSYTQGTVNRVNTLINQLAAALITA